MHFIEGDLTKIDLGLSAEDKERVLKTDVIIHAGGPWIFKRQVKR